MKNYVGIDLGTTNSAICTFDGEDVRIWKSPEQNDVTPSAIYIDKRGNKYVGKRAYDSAPQTPDNAALLFKRLMGTGSQIQLPAVNLTKSPEECSAEILKTLFGYLPEEIRNDPETGTVITVPAAFNQMQKDATMQAAKLAGIGNVALMQEPVAAVMSVMRVRKSDGIFLVYDLGGGTLDIAIADSAGGRVNLLAHGGIAMCGGRDWDRVLVDNVVKPWLFANFDLPNDISANRKYKKLLRLSAWAAEKAKIELSAREESVIAFTEGEMRLEDDAGAEIYLDAPLDRDSLDDLIASQIAESIEAARQTLSRTSLASHDVTRIVYVGGPTNYKPLRDKVSFELGIDASVEVNPMTAVAEGAAVFAESIDWSTQRRERKSNRGKLHSTGPLAVSFIYQARTPERSAKILVQLEGQATTGAEFQVDSQDTGWTSGRLKLNQGVSIDVALEKSGENTFKISAFDSVGRPITLGRDTVVITRTAAMIEAIPASHSIGVEVKGKLGGRTELDWLVRAGDHLPVKGSRVYQSEETLKAGMAGSINFKLWEGEINDEIQDNRFIGTFKVSSSDLNEGVIPAHAELHFDFEILDSGQIICEVSVPSVRASIRSGNFYTWQGAANYADHPDLVVEESQRTLDRVNAIGERIAHPKLDQARRKLEAAASIDAEEEDKETCQKAIDDVLHARRLLAQVRKENRRVIRQLDLEGVTEFFEQHLREHARPNEAKDFDNLARTASRTLDRTDNNFEHYLDQLKDKNFEILWRQDWFVVDRFKWMATSPHRFSPPSLFKELVTLGATYLQSDEIDKLRQVVRQLWQIQMDTASEAEVLDMVNIIRK